VAYYSVKKKTKLKVGEIFAKFLRNLNLVRIWLDLLRDKTYFHTNLQIHSNFKS